MQGSQQRFTILTETLPVSSLIYLMSVMAIPRTGHCSVERRRFTQFLLEMESENRGLGPGD